MKDVGLADLYFRIQNSAEMRTATIGYTIIEGSAKVDTMTIASAISYNLEIKTISNDGMPVSHGATTICIRLS